LNINSACIFILSGAEAIPDLESKLIKQSFRTAGRVSLKLLDINGEPDLAKKLEAPARPTVIVYKKGEEIERLDAADLNSLTENELTKLFQRHAWSLNV